jgi:hypothetical protein
LSCCANELLRANTRKMTVPCRPSESIIAFIRQFIFLSSVWKFTRYSCGVQESHVRLQGKMVSLNRQDV